VTIYLTPEDDCSSNPAVTLMLNANNTAIVVPEKVVLHKDFLCHYSPFFNAAFNGTFKEGLTQEMTLQADTTAFGIVAAWFYSQKNRTSRSEISGSPSPRLDSRTAISAAEVTKHGYG